MSLQGYPSFSNASVSDTVVQVSGSPIIVMGGFVRNTTAANAWIQMFNAQSANVALGTTTPTIAIVIFANAALGLSDLPGMVFDVALSIAGTTTRTGNTAAILEVDLITA